MRTPRTTTFDTDELETIRQVLAEIDDRLQGLGNRVRGGVIDVITALRGPDVIHVDAVIHKERGTNWVRRQALPMTSAESDNNVGRWSTWVDGRKPSTYSDDDADQRLWYHFNHHLEKAFDALGYEWDEVTPDPAPAPQENVTDDDADWKSLDD